MSDTKPKIDDKKLDEASDILREIFALTQKYDSIFKTLSVQEKHLIGGLVFRIHSVWSDIGMVGIMANRELAQEMINTLAVFYQNPDKFTPITGSGIQTAKSDNGMSN